MEEFVFIKFDISWSASKR